MFITSRFETVTHTQTHTCCAQLIPRLRRHLASRIPHERRELRAHDVWTFVNENLSRAVVVLLGQGHLWPMSYMRNKGYEDQMLRSPALQDRVIHHHLTTSPPHLTTSPPHHTHVHVHTHAHAAMHIHMNYY